MFAQIIDANHLVTRSLSALQNDCTLRNAQFFRQKPAQGRIGFSFYRWRLQLDLNSVAIISHDRIDLRVRNNVDLDSCHWLNKYPRDPLAQTHRLADAFHDLIRDFIRASRAFFENVVDVQFVG